MRTPKAVTGAEELEDRAESGREQTPLCVDLDGTLVRTDLLVEAIFSLLKENPLYVFLIPVWLCKGKAYLKHQVAQRVELEPASLPYHEAFLDYLRRERVRGRSLILASAAHRRLAFAVAEHLGLFDDVIATDETDNLSGGRKLRRLRAMFGERGFDYAGNGRVDLQVWPHARRAILVSPRVGLSAAAAALTEVDRVFDPEGGGLREYGRALRLHQWLKNLLVFVPLFAAHQAADPWLLGQALLGFLSFGLCASGVYLLNDLVDLSADRQHPRKRSRPFAAGTIPILHGVALIPALLVAAFLIASALPLQFMGALAGYYAVTLAYSFHLKRVVMVDVLVLAGLYTMRIVAGGAAVAVPLSFWLLAFSMFLFLSLAMVKRYSELLALPKDPRASVRGRGYQVVDLEALISLGSASGYMAVLVLALYINSDNVRELYTYPEIIWLLCPLLLYWVSRVWLAARRGKMHDDPLVFASRDRVSHLVAVAGAVILWFAS